MRIKNLIKGERHALRRSRFHDEKGNFVGWRRLVKHGSFALGSGLLRIAAGYRPPVPWISYDALQILNSRLNKQSRVLEFGSGMSTVWFSTKCGEVCSVEDYKPWFEKVSKILEKSIRNNVKYFFAESPDEYFRFCVDDESGFDLVLVDGNHRAKCIEHASSLIRPGGMLYLDNSDKHRSSEGDCFQAEKMALEFASRNKAEIRYFTDFAPTQFFVQEGLLVSTAKHVTGQ